MRRSDQEFKEELWLRVAEYKVRQRKRRENALKAASVAVMACVLFISAQGVKFAEEEWQWPTERPAIDGPVADRTTAAADEIVDVTKGAADEMEGVVTDEAEETVDYGGEVTESPTEKSPETEGTLAAESQMGSASETQSPTESPAEVVTASKVTIETMGPGFNSAGDGAGYSEYENPTLAGELAKYLAGLMEAATEVPTVEEAETNENLKTDEEAETDGDLKTDEDEESGALSGSTSVEGTVDWRKHKFTIRYSDGTEVSYIVKQGDGALQLDAEGCLILDRESWDRLSQIIRDYR